MNITWPFRNKTATISTPEQHGDVNDMLDRLFQDMARQATAIEDYQVDLANDVTGNLGVSHLAGGSGADATHFWAGDGAWKVPPDTRGIPELMDYKSAWIVALPAASIAVGCAENSSNVAALVDANASWRDLTSALNGTQCFWAQNSTHFWLNHDPIFNARIRTGADITNYLVWIGFYSSASFTNVDTLAASGTGLRFSTRAGDTAFIGASYDGVAQSTTAAIGTFAASTIYYVRIEVSGSGTLVTFTVMDANQAVLGTATLATRIKTGTAMRGCITMYPLANAAHHLAASFLYTKNKS